MSEQSAGERSGTGRSVLDEVRERRGGRPFVGQPTREPRSEHVWVLDPRTQVRRPGLLVESRQGLTCEESRVVFMDWRGGEWVSSDEWVIADLVLPCH